LLAEGGFEVSAAKRDGVTEYVQVRSLAGGPLRLKTGISGEIAVEMSDDLEYTVDIEDRRLVRLPESTIFEMEMKKGQIVTIYPCVDSLIGPSNPGNSSRLEANSL
jgi:alpha-L-fucosidase 2